MPFNFEAEIVFDVEVIQDRLAEDKVDIRLLDKLGHHTNITTIRLPKKLIKPLIKQLLDFAIFEGA